MKRILIIIMLFARVVLPAQDTIMRANAKVYPADCALSSAAIHVTGGKPPYFYQWSNGLLGDTASSLTVGNYSVRVTDSDTSHADVSFSVNDIVCKVSFSGKFSPNGDGINDLWTGERLDQYPNFLVQVYDRWGQVVHTQRKQFVPWDGTHLGIRLPDATYYWVFFYEEFKLNKLEKGNVTIVR